MSRGDADGIGVAVVGSSGFAARTAAPTSAASNLEFCGVLGSTPRGSRSLASLFGVRPYSSLEDMLGDERVVAVWITAPDHLHESIGTAALLAGKHILIEKPMACNEAGAGRLLDVASDVRAVIRVGCHQRFRPAYMKLRDEAQTGRFGTIRSLRTNFFFGGFEEETIIGSWRADFALNGGAWVSKEFGSHLLDLLRWIVDEDLVVEGAMFGTQRYSVETEDAASILLRSESGALCSVDVSAACMGRAHSLEVYGSKGWAQAQDVWRGGGIITYDSGERARYQRRNRIQPYIDQLHDLAAAIWGACSSGATGEDGVEVMRMISKAVRVALDVDPRRRGSTLSPENRYRATTM